MWQLQHKVKFSENSLIVWLITATVFNSNRNNQRLLDLRKPECLGEGPKIGKNLRKRLGEGAKQGFTWCEILLGDLCSLGPKDFLEPPLNRFRGSSYLRPLSQALWFAILDLQSPWPGTVLPEVLWEIGVLWGVLPRVLRETGGAPGSATEGAQCGGVNRKSTLRSTPWSTPGFPEHPWEHPSEHPNLTTKR